MYNIGCMGVKSRRFSKNFYIKMEDYTNVRKSCH